MFALVTIFLTTLLVAMTVVWLYRLVSSWKGFKRNQAGRPNTNTNIMRLSAQQGYITLAAFPQGRSQMSPRRVMQHTAKNEIKAPWGW